MGSEADLKDDIIRARWRVDEWTRRRDTATAERERAQLDLQKAEVALRALKGEKK